MNLSDPGIKTESLTSPALVGGVVVFFFFLTTNTTWEAPVEEEKLGHVKSPVS